MEDFRTLEGASALFQSVDGISVQNNIFVVFKNTTREGMKAGLAGGLAGGLLSAGLPSVIVKTGKAAETVLEGKFTGLLINQTENGLGIIPMHQKGLQLTLNADKLEPEPENYIFIGNEAISEIKVKNFNIFNKKVQKVNIAVDKYKLYLMARISEKSIPYQQENFAKFMDQYKAKK